MGSWRVSLSTTCSSYNVRPHILHTDKSNVLPQTTPEMYSAKSELFHLCKEIEFTGDLPPTLEHVISMIMEDILGEAEGISAASTSQATQRRRMMQVPGTSHLDIHHNSRPSALSSGRRRALRAHHLPHNHLKRARRLGYKHRHLTSDLLGDLLDAISVEGGFDGAGIFFKLDLDISKQAVSSLENLLTMPLDVLSEVDLLQKLFPSATGSGDAVNVNSATSIDISLSASARLSIKGKSAMIKRHHVFFLLLGSSKLILTLFSHLYCTVGYEINGSEIKDIIFGNTDITVNEIAEKAFIEFEDISTKFVGSAKLDAGLNIGGGNGIGIENATLAFGFGIGLEEANKVYFSNISSMPLAVRDSNWRKVAVLDASIPITASVNIGGYGLSLEPIVDISSCDFKIRLLIELRHLFIRFTREEIKT